MKLVITLATRGRPQKLLDTIKRSTANLVLPNTVYMVQVDDDDTETIGALAKAELDARVAVNIKPREDTIAAKWNRALSEPADLYLVAADDDPYVTPEYDAKFLEAAKLFPDGIGMVYGRMANSSFTGAVSITRKLTEKYGNIIFPEYFPYWFVDHWTDDLAKLIGRIAFADVGTDQSDVGKTQEMREPAWWATWFDAAYLIRRRIALKIIDDPEFQTPDWQKEILRRQMPLVEHKSRSINDYVRKRDVELRLWSGLDDKMDERYLRLRDKAVAMIPQLFDGMNRDEVEQFRAMLLLPMVVQAAWDHQDDRLAALLKQWL